MKVAVRWWAGSLIARGRVSLLGLGALLVTGLGTSSRGAGEFEGFLKPFFEKNCTKCHGEEKTKGKVNLAELANTQQFLGKPGLIKELIEVIDSYDMPPEDEPELDEDDRTRALAGLKEMLGAAASIGKARPVQLRRLNRFQYNNAVRDLFRLDRDVFSLQEKLMTRRGDYLTSGEGKMPDKVEVVCLSLAGEGGMREVRAFPKDLRAAHGFDNQANQLSLSPLLLDTFLRLSVSILDSPDFNEETVGAWNELLGAAPPGADLRDEVRKRLAPFLLQAFRGPIDEETLGRYTAYVVKKCEQGLSLTESMKKVASAVLSSPRFLFRYGASTDEEDLFLIASNLSFFLWGSGPDQELLRLAETGELSRVDVFDATVERMFRDPRIERFLDSFPSQWMQLENILAVTPDPAKARLFSLDRDYPASLQMVLEPLLLFDAVFLEDRPIVELIAPEFSYQSEFLKTWYTSDLKAPQIDAAHIVRENEMRGEQRRELGASIKQARSELESLLKPVRARLVQSRRKGKQNVVDLRPFAAWEFNGNLEESIRGLHLKAHGKIRYENGMVVLDKAFLQSGSLPVDLKAKTLEVWCLVHDVNQRGGGVMGIQGPGDFFDTIVLGERKPRHWISGSNGFSRTLDFPESTPEDKPNERLHLAMVYQEDGTTTLYRNGKAYGKPFRKGNATFPKGNSSVLFGLRHLPAGGNRYLSISLARARLYDRALSAEEVAGSRGGLYISEEELVAALTPEQKTSKESLESRLARAEEELARVPPDRDPGKAQQEVQKQFDDEIRRKLRSQTFERLAATDPRYGGIITNAAMLSMTSGPKRTHPIARGAWVIEVVLNDPPPPPPNDVPPLNEDAAAEHLTIREKFAKHRENPDCAGCHSRLDPLGFALENFDITGRWRDKYENGREVDSSGRLFKRHGYDDVVRFKETLAKEENKRFARAFIAHVMRFALSQELDPSDSLVIDEILRKTGKDGFRMKSIMREVIMSKRFVGGG